jgi:hypothetical protein
MVMRNKRGWLRILEATIAIMMVTGVLLVMYSRQAERVDISDYVYSFQRQVLMDITSRQDLRAKALSNSIADLRDLNEFADGKIPDIFNQSIRICDLGLVCKLDDETSIRLFRASKEVFVEEVVISADFDDYAPKKVKLFLWEEN